MTLSALRAVQCRIGTLGQGRVRFFRRDGGAGFRAPARRGTGSGHNPPYGMREGTAEAGPCPARRSGTP